jgi:hypothetical protein
VTWPLPYTHSARTHLACLLHAHTRLMVVQHAHFHTHGYTGVIEHTRTHDHTITPHYTVLRSFVVHCCIQ